MSSPGDLANAGAARPGLARGVPGTQLAAPAASGVTEVARPVTGRASGHRNRPGPVSAVPGGTRLGAAEARTERRKRALAYPGRRACQARTARASAGAGPCAGRPVPEGHGARVAKEPLWSVRRPAERQRSGRSARNSGGIRGRARGSARRDGCVSKRRDGSGPDERTTDTSNLCDNLPG